MTQAPSLRIITIAGVSILVVMSLIPLVLKRGLQPDERQRVNVAPSASPFEGERAMADIEALVTLGPRPAGSEASLAAAAYIARNLRSEGARVTQETLQSPESPVALTNVIGVVEGRKPGIILITCHYDTAGGDTVGANAGGSGVGVLLELARQFGARRDGYSLWLCFFDGAEEGPGRPPRLGSRLQLQKWKNDGALNEIRAAIAVDAVGDCYLGIAKDLDAPRWLQDFVASTAGAVGYERHFTALGAALAGDHITLRGYQIPTVCVADTRFGGSVVQHRNYWHTASDTLDRVCPESLQAVGDVIYHAVLGMDANPHVQRPR